MKTLVARLITYGVVAALAATAFVFIRPLPDRKPAQLLKAESRGAWRETDDSLRLGETLTHALVRRGFTASAAAQILQAATWLDPRRLRAGLHVTYGALPADSTPREITLRMAIDRVLHLTQSDSGWVAREDTLPWHTDTLVVRGTISTTLYDALDSAAAALPPRMRTELAWTVADIYQWRIDMSRDLQVGDSFAVLVERQQGAEGAMRSGRVLAATFSTGGSTIQAIRHESSDEEARYYDQAGRSLQANFLRAPVEFRRISSGFGNRLHPILGTWRKHEGTDYAAAAGTPVRAIGDGVVISAGVRGGYGNAIDVRHANGIVTRYGHLRGFAHGIHAGARVSMGETIGYVGMTGLATGPHLHFEVIVNGVQRNPRTALSRAGGAPIADADRPGFEALKAEYLGLLERLSTRTTANNN